MSKQTIPPSSATPSESAPPPVWRVSAEGAIRLVDAAPDGPPIQRPERNRQVLRRRQLLRRGFWVGIGVLAVGGLASAADFLTPRIAPRFSGVITVPANKVPRPGGEPYYERAGKFWLVNLKPGEGSPIQFRSFGDPSHAGGLLALYQACTHLGCPVPWRDDFEFGGVTGWFLCPCHAATYTKAGLRVFGPALRSMDTFPIIGVSARGVSVSTTRLKMGASNDPQRTIPPGSFS